MRISMVTNSTFGGMWNHVTALSEHLVDKNEVSIISRRKGSIGKIKLHGLPSVAIYTYELCYKKHSLIKLLKEIDPNVVHMHHQVGNLGSYTEKIKKLGKPVVSTVHLTPSKRTLMDLWSYGYFKKHKKSISLSDEIICVSKCVQDGFSKIGIENTIVIPNGIDPKFFYPIKNAKQKIGYEDDKPLLFFSGRLAPEKGILKMLKAAKMLIRKGVDFNLHIAGSGPISSVAKLYSKRFKQVNFLGRIPFKEIGIHYSAADLTLFPSTYDEAFGLVIIESMACGTPVIGFNVGAIPELINSKNGLVVDKVDSQSLADGIEEMLNKKIDKKYCINYVKKNYTWDIVADKTEKLYKSLSSK